VARWAAQPIETGQPRGWFEPIVIGPHLVPAITEPSSARRSPELALLSAIAHARGSLGFDVGRAAFLGATELDRDTRMLYSDMILWLLPAAARDRMEEWMRIEDYEFRSEYALRNQALGREAGREEGRAEGLARALLKVLSARGVAVSDDQERQILECADIDTLDNWLERALSGTPADELFH
jgi:hypothetical protein